MTKKGLALLQQAYTVPVEFDGTAAAPDALALRHVAADIGNATALVATTVRGSTPVVWQAPTAKAMIGLALPPTLAADDLVLVRDGLPLALGATALRYSDAPIASRGSGDRYTGFTLDFILAGLASLARSERLSVGTLAATVPAEHADRAAEIAEALAGRHVFVLNGRSHIVTIKRVQVIREGEAAASSLAVSEGNAIVIDGGGGTTHIALFRNGKLIDVRTRATGYQRVIDVADDMIKRQTGRRLTPLERFELEQATAKGQGYKIWNSGNDIDVAPILRAARSRVADTIIADIKEIVPAWRRAHAIWLVGGQAYHLRSEYEAAFPGIRVPSRYPERANVLGALRLVAGLDVGEGDDHGAN